jgi:hypothetical protein
LVREAYNEAYARAPTPQEVGAAEEFIEKQASQIASEKGAAEKFVPIPFTKSIERAKAAAIVDFCHAIFCSNEFLYVD